jgi:hypothetical protein
MHVTYPRKSALFRSWEPDDATSLTVLIAEDGVSLQHCDDRHYSTEVTVLQLTIPEAVEVAERILRVLRGGPAQTPEEDAQAPQLVVTLTNDGEPYREGVSLALSTGDWNRDFSFSMSNDTARDLATAMHAAGD